MGQDVHERFVKSTPQKNSTTIEVMRDYKKEILETFKESY